MNHAILGILLAGAALPALARTTDAPAPVAEPHVRTPVHCATDTSPCRTAPKPPAPPRPPAPPAPPRPDVPPAPAVPPPPHLPPVPAADVPPVPASTS